MQEIRQLRVGPTHSPLSLWLSSKSQTIPSLYPPQAPVAGHAITLVPPAPPELAVAVGEQHVRLRAAPDLFVHFRMVIDV